MHPIFPPASRQSQGYSSGPRSPRNQARQPQDLSESPESSQAPRQPALKSLGRPSHWTWTGPIRSGFHHSPVPSKQQISDTHTGNLAPLIPAAPLVHDVFSLLLCPIFASPWSVNRDKLPPTREPGRLRAASHAPARSAGPARLRYETLESKMCSDRDGRDRPFPAVALFHCPRRKGQQ